MRVLVAALLLIACNRGNNYVDPPGSVVMDLATAPPDLTPPPPDLLVPGPTCGQIAQCALGCGQDFTCIGMCAQGADPSTLTALGGLLLCAGTSCLSIDADAGLGGIDMTQLFMCLLQSCGQQLSMCPLFGGL
jgi:hypothetical protein